jgi:hypothetical protein
MKASRAGGSYTSREHIACPPKQRVLLQSKQQLLQQQEFRHCRVLYFLRHGCLWLMLDFLFLRAHHCGCQHRPQQDEASDSDALWRSVVAPGPGLPRTASALHISASMHAHMLQQMRCRTPCSAPWYRRTHHPCGHMFCDMRYSWLHTSSRYASCLAHWRPTRNAVIHGVHACELHSTPAHLRLTNSTTASLCYGHPSSRGNTGRTFMHNA